MSKIRDCYGKIVPDSAMIIRATEVSEFLNCPRKWFIHSHNGLNMEPDIINPNLRIGKIWHEGLEAYYGGSQSSEVAKQAMIDEAEKDKTEMIMEGMDIITPDNVEKEAKDMAMLMGLMDAYPVWARSVAQPADDSLEIIDVERRIVVPIYTPRGYRSRAYLAVKVDAIVKDNLNRLWIMEHKTRGKSHKIDDPTGLEIDLQLGLQLLALQKATEHSGSSVAGTIYNLVRKQEPTPRVKAPLFGRHKVFRTPDQLQYLQGLLYDISKDMRRVKRLAKYAELPPRNWQLTPPNLDSIPFNPQIWAGGFCIWGCKALPICSAIMERDDVGFLLVNLFVKRKKDIWQMLEDEME